AGRRVDPHAGHARDEPGLAARRAHARARGTQPPRRRAAADGARMRSRARRNDDPGLLAALDPRPRRLLAALGRRGAPALGRRGPGRRVSQHTSAAALEAGLVPPERVARVVDGILGGRLVVTKTLADVPPGRGTDSQLAEPEGFDPERDVVACQPFFCRFL